MGTPNSRSRVAVMVGLIAAVFWAAGLVAFAGGNGGNGPADGGATPETPGSCTPPTEPCTLANGCPGVHICVGGKYSTTCTCLTGGGSAPCTACGVGGTATCSSTCTPGTCSQPPPQACNPNGCQSAGTQQCNVATNQWGACTGCGGAISCTTSCASTGSGTCSSATCAFSGTCTPPAEVCNGKDDDCNGLVDDGITCSACDGL